MGEEAGWVRDDTAAYKFEDLNFVPDFDSE